MSQRGRGAGRGSGRGSAGSAASGRGYSSTITPITFETETPTVLETPPPHASVVRVTGNKLSKATSQELPAKRELKPTPGEQIEVLVNRLRVEMPSSVAHTYSVDFFPDIKERGKRKKVVFMAVKKLCKNEQAVDENRLVFDRGNLMLQFKGAQIVKDSESAQVILDKPGQAREQYRVDVKLTKDPNPYQAFGVALQAGLSSEGKISIRGKLYNSGDSIQVPEHKCELLLGLKLALYSTECGIMLQVDQTYKHVRTDTILDMLKSGTCAADLVSKIGLCKYTAANMKSRQTFDITEIITDKTPDTFLIKIRGGEEITLTRYYEQTYGLIVTDKLQPLIKSVSRKTNVAEPEVRYFLPEFTVLAGEIESMKRDRRRRTDLIKRTASSPSERMEYIIKQVDNMLSPKFDGELKKYDVKISRKFIKTKAVVLPSPEMKFKELSLPKGATWEEAFRKDSLPLFRVNEIKKLAVIGADDETAAFVDREMERCRAQFGMGIAAYTIFRNKLRSTNDCQNECKKVITDGYTFVYAILDRPNEAFYAAIKQTLCAPGAGIPSQVFTRQNVQNAALTKATKITVQVITKAGGVPWATKMPFKGPTMMFGIAVHGTKDVFHRDISQDKTMGALVGSLSSVMGDFISTPILVDKRTQLFSPVKHPLEKYIKEAAGAFFEKNKTWPQQLIVYRDGGAEGDYSDILKSEVDEFQKVATYISTQLKKPCSLTFVLVFRKTGCRVFKTDLTNPKPGTLVEKTITSSTVQEFYLQSHSVNQGSASPTKYFVLYDDSKIENLPDITFAATHSYFNWNATIPTPSVLKYAEKLAAFAGGVLRTDVTHAQLKYQLYYL